MPPHIHSEVISGLTPLCSLAKTYPMWQPRKIDLPIVKSQTGKIYQTKLCTVFSLYLIFKFKFLKFSHLFGMLFTSHVVKLVTHQAEIHVTWKLIPHALGMHLHTHFPVHVHIHNLYEPENIYRVVFFSLCLHLISPSILALSSFPVQLALGHFYFDLISQDLLLHDSSKFLHLLNYTMPLYYTVPI